MRKGSKLSGFELFTGISLLTAGLAANVYGLHIAGYASTLTGIGIILIGIVPKVKRNAPVKARISVRKRKAK